MDKETAQRLKSISVLYAEDEDNIRLHIADTLKYYVKEVIEARNGEEAYTLYQEKKPDIILSDILMPVMDGIKFVEMIRKEDEIIPIILITAHTEKNYLLSAVRLHLEEYLIKPINLDKILTLLIKCLDKVAHKHDLSFRLPAGYHYAVDKKILTYHDQTIKLSKKEIKFFEVLLHNHHRVVTYEELQEYVWGDDFMTDNALRAVVLNLRRKLPDNLITNLSGVGYKLENI